jgi:acyl-CoA thioesterase FadM
MSTAVLTRWPVRVEFLVLADDVDEHDCPTDHALDRWFATAWSACLQRCQTLRDVLSDRGTRLALGSLRLSSRRSVRPGDRVWMAVGATELRPSAFDLAIRVRVLGSDAAPILEGHRSVGLVDTASGSSLPIPVQIQKELMALADTASEYC